MRETALLLKMLELKYGTLPGWEKERMVQANAKTIETWAVKTLKAQTSAEVFDKL